MIDAQQRCSFYPHITCGALGAGISMFILWHTPKNEPRKRGKGLAPCIPAVRALQVETFGFQGSAERFCWVQFSCSRVKKTREQCGGVVAIK